MERPWDGTWVGTRKLVLDHPVWSAVVFLITLFLPSILAEFLDSSPSLRSRVADAFVPNLWTMVVLIVGLVIVATSIVPVRQRNTARAIADRLSEELTERDRIDFVLKADHEYWPNARYDFGDVVVHDRTWLWVDVKNSGPPAHFSASVEGVSPVERFSDGETRPSFDVNRLGWEHQLDKSQVIARNENERLRVAWYSATPGVLAFWMPESATWGMGEHNFGWRLRCLGPVVTFDLAVRNTTSDKTVVRPMEIRLDENGKLIKFGFLDTEAS
jgi:hypothetical protein